MGWRERIDSRAGNHATCSRAGRTLDPILRFVQPVLRSGRCCVNGIKIRTASLIPIGCLKVFAVFMFNLITARTTNALIFETMHRSTGTKSFITSGSSCLRSREKIFRFLGDDLALLNCSTSVFRSEDAELLYSLDLTD